MYVMTMMIDDDDDISIFGSATFDTDLYCSEQLVVSGCISTVR